MAYEEESKNYYKEMLTKRLVYELYLYKKYFEDSHESMFEYFKSCLDNWILDDNEIQQIINNAKKEMKESYKLEIVCDEPLMFKKIDIS